MMMMMIIIIIIMIISKSDSTQFEQVNSVATATTLKIYKIPAI
jgi:hypothetical protein